MMMPMGSCAGSEHDIVDCDALLFVAVDWISPDVAGEGRSTELGLFARGTGIADNSHRHIEIGICGELGTGEVFGCGLGRL